MPRNSRIGWRLTRRLCTDISGRSRKKFRQNVEKISGVPPRPTVPLSAKSSARDRQRVLDLIVSVVSASVFFGDKGAGDVSRNRASSLRRSCAANSISASLANVGVGSPVASSWCDVLSTTRLTHIACPQEIPRCIRASRNKNRSSYSDGCKQSRRGYTGRVLCAIQEAIARFFQKCASAVLGSKYSARSTHHRVRRMRTKNTDWKRLMFRSFGPASQFDLKHTGTNDSYAAVHAAAHPGSLRAEPSHPGLFCRISVSKNRDRVVPKAL